jgi:NAD(P)-dependent dehydrogenase (short-subunit alcohol dehydrogenase family)
MQISGSSAVVVGGAGGLGEATVRRLVAAGAKVVVADLADEKGKALTLTAARRSGAGSSARTASPWTWTASGRPSSST